MQLLKEPRQFRQGDVLLVKTDHAAVTPKHLPVPRDEGRVVLAYGEVTGHAHVFKDPGICLLSREGIGDRVVTLDLDSLLTHEEHGAIPVPAGDYKVVIQREWDGADALPEQAPQGRSFFVGD